MQFLLFNSFMPMEILMLRTSQATIVTFCRKIHIKKYIPDIVYTDFSKSHVYHLN